MKHSWSVKSRVVAALLTSCSMLLTGCMLGGDADSSKRPVTVTESYNQESLPNDRGEKTTESSTEELAADRATVRKIPGSAFDGAPQGLEREAQHSKIFRQSEGWEFLSNPDQSVPGSQFYVADGSCSVGWMVEEKADPSRTYILTAGHCTLNTGDYAEVLYNNEWYELGQTVWTTGDSRDQGGGDWALIELTANEWDSSLPWTGPHISGWANADWIEENDPYICRLGYRSGLSCGQFIGFENDYTIRYENISDHGDSGGPVWALDPDTGEWWAIGVASFMQYDDATNAGALLIEPVMQEFGLDIL